MKSDFAAPRNRDDAFPREAIQRLVYNFYDAVRADADLGPVFDRRIQDWSPHLKRMTLFWTAVLRGEPVFTPGPRGGPPALHRGIEELRHEHFDRWLTLFEHTAREIFDDSQVQFVMTWAQRMRRTLSAHLATQSA